MQGVKKWYPCMLQKEEAVHDGKILKRLINNTKNRDSISKVIADGSYDSNENLLSIPIK